ncbi:CocE/NonD family hydrolase [Epidermidibacterium keratini]|uniref:CocE/NonD family hydrolase n=2 Tax=Epidermidibacterium keratini TaxID=1891644 RepID=A0A7L4YSZ1_9ACTN|nr:CocE/NonD family hydrolase [Epidermidibacterium keratini]
MRRATGAVADKLLKVDGPRQDYEIERDVEVTMPDGVVLLADRYYPSDASGPLPVVLVRTPYGRTGLLSTLLLGPLARRGFQLFVQSTRGTFGSGGQFRPFQTEPEDGAATLAWLRRQPWCDGRIASTGPSYLGHTQWAVAPYADPPLVAAGLHITAAHISEAFYTRGGVPGLRNALTWAAMIGTQERRWLPPLVPNAPQMLRLRRAMHGLPLQSADTAVAGAPVQFWRDFTAHELPGDDFWDAADHQEADLSAMPPVNMVTGWWDLFVRSQLHDFARLQQAGVPARITIGPWLHGDPPEVEAIVRTDLEWLGHYLNGEPLPPGPAVRAQLMGTDEWLEFESWPPPGYADATHYLGGGGVLDDAPSQQSAPTRFTYDPADPTPTVGGPMLSAPGRQSDNTKNEQRGDILTFTGPVLDDAVDIVGAPTARIFVRTSTPYADLFVRVCDVDAEGTSRNVVDGIRRLSPADGPDSTDDAGVAVVELELFPTAYRFAAGHRIRVQVAGGAFPRFARNFGDGERFAAGSSGVPVDFEIFHDAAHPSTVTLPSKTRTRG